MRRHFALVVALVVLGGVLSPPSAHAQQGGITGEIPPNGGLALIGWAGGSIGELDAAAGAAGCDLQSIWITVDGRLVGYTLGVPAFVNAAFTAEAGTTLAPRPLLIVCAVPPGPAPRSARLDYIDVGQGDATLITRESNDDSAVVQSELQQH